MSESEELTFISQIKIEDRVFEGIELAAGYDSEGNVLLALRSDNGVKLFSPKPNDVMSILELLAGAAARVEQIENWAAADAKNECRCYTCNRHVDKPGFCDTCVDLHCEQEQITNLQITPR